MIDGLSRKVSYASMLLVILQTGYYDDGVTNCDSIDNDLKIMFSYSRSQLPH